MASVLVTFARVLPPLIVHSVPSNWVIASGYKACCSPTLSDNVNIVIDNVNGFDKPVLALGAITRDNPPNCKPGAGCHKLVMMCDRCRAAVCSWPPGGDNNDCT